MSSSTNITEWNVTTEKWYTGNIETISKPQIRRVKAIECCSQRGWWTITFEVGYTLLKQYRESCYGIIKEEQFEILLVFSQQ